MLKPSLPRLLILAGLLLPALACAAVALVLSVVTGGGIIAPVLSGLWHGGVTFGLVGAAYILSKSRKQES